MASGDRPLMGLTQERRYELVSRLATGGMAEVYLGRAVGPGFEKRVVIKRVRSDLAHDGAFIRMLLDEGRIAATLQHPNIAQVFDVGEAADGPFVVMEYVEGQTVRALLQAERGRKERVPLPHCLAIAQAVAAALHHAHEKCDAEGRPLGIVHRDVSPSNVLVSYEGAIKLLDFGIARTLGREGATRAGVLKGKVGYMSPEQGRGDPVDRRSDLFSLGLLLYELTCGSPPFQGDDDLVLLNQLIQSDVPPPSSKAPEYPPALEEIVLRCLRRDRTSRYDTALELQRDLERFARSAGAISTPGDLARYLEDTFPARAGATELRGVALVDGPSMSARTLELPAPSASGAEKRRPLVLRVALALLVAAGVGGGVLALGRGLRAQPPPPSRASAIAPGAAAGPDDPGTPRTGTATVPNATTVPSATTQRSGTAVPSGTTRPSAVAASAVPPGLPSPQEKASPPRRRVLRKPKARPRAAPAPAPAPAPTPDRDSPWP